MFYATCVALMSLLLTSILLASDIWKTCILLRPLLSTPGIEKPFVPYARGLKGAQSHESKPRASVQPRDNTLGSDVGHQNSPANLFTLTMTLFKQASEPLLPFPV